MSLSLILYSSARYLLHDGGPQLETPLLVWSFCWRDMEEKWSHWDRLWPSRQLGSLVWLAEHWQLV